MGLEQWFLLIVGGLGERLIDCVFEFSEAGMLAGMQFRWGQAELLGLF